MTSNLGCVGLGVDGEEGFEHLVRSVLPRARLFGRVGDVEVRRWEDPSGARLILGTRHGQLTDFLPSCASEPGARLASVRRANGAVVQAAVVDESGDQLTSVAFELEQNRFLAGAPESTVFAAIVALGRSVSVHADTDAFAASDDSLLGGADAQHGDPPSHFAERGWAWPPRLAAESFFSDGMFRQADEVDAAAHLSGIVLRADRRTVGETGQCFTVARVRTVGFETDVCLGIDEHPDVPQPGQIISGEVFLVGSIESLWRTRRRSLLAVLRRDRR